MFEDAFDSVLPSIENFEKLDLWQSMGIASMLISCHKYYSLQRLSDFFSTIKSSLESNRCIILFNSENRPAALATYRFYDELEHQAFSSKNVKEDDVVFDYIISPFSSPLNIYRFLKDYLLSKNNNLKNAYLINVKEERMRLIW